MRRFVAAALLALFVLQSCGAAMATPLAAPRTTSLLAQAQFAFSQALESLANTHIGALVLGRESQYEAMHAPPPDFAKARAAAARPITRPNLNLPKIVPQLRAGIELHPRVTDWHAFNLHAPPRDPLAISHGVSPALCYYFAAHKSAAASAIRHQIICGGGGGGGGHDPMSQKPFMWNRNNPLNYSDPSGYDSIEMYARDVSPSRDHGTLAHMFIVVRDDHGKVKQVYSFGPSNDGTPFGSQLVSRHYAADSPNGATIFGHSTIGGCKKGTCTQQNGGFDEPGLATTAQRINDGDFRYGAWQNSNSAAYTMCTVNGG